jgi:hypothetical protein
MLMQKIIKVVYKGHKTVYHWGMSFFIFEKIKENMPPFQKQKVAPKLFCT